LAYLNNMTNEQINAAIAEALGWREEDGVYVWNRNGIDRTCWELWDWCNDLNAMHEAEQSLWARDRNLRYDYISALSGVENPTIYSRLDAVDMLDLTARQRAEAFLRVLGKWKGDHGKHE
jgi:hypothetical protein